jgi:hypothetical protein
MGTQIGFMTFQIIQKCLPIQYPQAYTRNAPDQRPDCERLLFETTDGARRESRTRGRADITMGRQQRSYDPQALAEAAEASRPDNVVRLESSVDWQPPASRVRQALGKMTSTTLQNANSLAEKSVKLAHDMLTDDPKYLHDTIQAELITKDNVDKYIDLHKQLGDIK